MWMQYLIRPCILVVRLQNAQFKMKGIPIAEELSETLWGAFGQSEHSNEIKLQIQFYVIGNK